MLHGRDPERAPHGSCGAGIAEKEEAPPADRGQEPKSGRRGLVTRFQRYIRSPGPLGSLKSPMRGFRGTRLDARRLRGHETFELREPLPGRTNGCVLDKLGCFPARPPLGRVAADGALQGSGRGSTQTLEAQASAASDTLADRVRAPPNGWMGLAWIRGSG